MEILNFVTDQPLGAPIMIGHVVVNMAETIRSGSDSQGLLLSTKERLIERFGCRILEWCSLSVSHHKKC